MYSLSCVVNFKLHIPDFVVLRSTLSLVPLRIGGGTTSPFGVVPGGTPPAPRLRPPPPGPELRPDLRVRVAPVRADERKFNRVGTQIC